VAWARERCGRHAGGTRAVALFISNRLPVGVVALGAALALYGAGVI
jgi:hypothetical protein